MKVKIISSINKIIRVHCAILIIAKFVRVWKCVKFVNLSKIVIDLCLKIV